MGNVLEKLSLLTGNIYISFPIDLGYRTQTQTRFSCLCLHISGWQFQFQMNINRQVMEPNGFWWRKRAAHCRYNERTYSGCAFMVAIFFFFYFQAMMVTRWDALCFNRQTWTTVSDFCVAHSQLFVQKLKEKRKYKSFFSPFLISDFHFTKHFYCILLCNKNIYGFI
jgi:hypothetical protein